MKNTLKNVALDLHQATVMALVQDARIPPKYCSRARSSVGSGIGVLTATALFETVGNVHSFPDGRRLACWLGLTPREFSSGARRRLGRISKQGDPYVRTLLIHGARARIERRPSSGKGG